MSQSVDKPIILASFWELKQMFERNWVDQWILPNPFVKPLADTLSKYETTLKDFSFSSHGKNLGDDQLRIEIQTIAAEIHLGLDHVNFWVNEPDWQNVPRIVEILGATSTRIVEIVGFAPRVQSSDLVFHLKMPPNQLHQLTSKFSNPQFVGRWDFYGISLHRKDSALVIDKSQKYEEAAFIRLQRQFSGEVSFSEMAIQIYKDELDALNLLDISEVP